MGSTRARRCSFTIRPPDPMSVHGAIPAGRPVPIRPIQRRTFVRA
jgi:hypothetical protein